MQENNATPSNIMQMKADITKQIKMMLQNNSLQFSVASIGMLC